MRIPGDFDVAQISCHADYDSFFYGQLSRRARRIYLFRGEYIFDLEKAIVVETPQLGYLTYIFAKPRSMESFLALYTRIAKEDIRRNWDNVGERLGFLGRVIHGSNPRAWLKEMDSAWGRRPTLLRWLPTESQMPSRSRQSVIGEILSFHMTRVRAKIISANEMIAKGRDGCIFPELGDNTA